MMNKRKHSRSKPEADYQCLLYLSYLMPKQQAGKTNLDRSKRTALKTLITNVRTHLSQEMERC